jgi:hypothetical protein
MALSERSTSLALDAWPFSISGIQRSHACGNARMLACSLLRVCFFAYLCFPRVCVSFMCAVLPHSGVCFSTLFACFRFPPLFSHRRSTQASTQGHDSARLLLPLRSGSSCAQLSWRLAYSGARRLWLCATPMLHWLSVMHSRPDTGCCPAWLRWDSVTLSLDTLRRRITPALGIPAHLEISSAPASPFLCPSAAPVQWSANAEPGCSGTPPTASLIGHPTLRSLGSRASPALRPSGD